MATPKVKATVTTTWADHIGTAASVAGVSWQNLGPDHVLLAFTTSTPGSSDGYHGLAAGEAFYDKNGSAHAWAKSVGSHGATLVATAD